MERTEVDIKENSVMEFDAELLAILLQDKNSGKNIIWATDNYIANGFGYGSADEISLYLITGKNGGIIKPRTEKQKKSSKYVLKIKLKFLHRLGFATNRIILLIMLGSDVKMFLILNLKRLG